MKKIALVLAVLLVVGGAAFAEITVGGEATVSGSVTTTVGMDLQSSVWGADAASSITLEVPFVNGTAGASGDDDLYGQIDLVNVGVNWNEDEFEDADLDGTLFTGIISAKIVAGDVYMGLNWGGYNNNYAAGTADYDVNLDDDWYTAPAYGDLAFGYMSDAFDFEFEIAPKSGITRAVPAGANEDFVGAWDGETAESYPTATTQAATGVVLSVDLEIAADPITLPIYVTLDPEYTAGETLLGISIDPTIKVSDDVTITCPADFVGFLTANDMGFDAAPTLSVTVAEGFSVAGDAYFYNHFNTMYLVNAGVTFTEATAAGFLGDTVGASLDVDLTDLTGTLGWGVDVKVDVALDEGLTLNLGPDFDSTNDFDFDASLVMGSAFTGIDNTTITLDYANACYDVVDGYGAGASDAGVLSLITKVAF